MNTNSNVYTVIYTTLVVVAVAAVLAFAATKLRPAQDANAKAETLRQMMSAAQIKPTDELYATRNADILQLYADNVAEAYTIGLDGRKNGTLSTDKARIELVDRLKPQDKAIKDGTEATLPVYVFKNGVTVHGATLHKAGLSFEVVQSQVGNVLAADEKPETSLKLAARAPGKWTLRRVVRDVDGNVLADATEAFSGEKTFTFDLSQKSVGWYALDYTVAKDDRVVLTHKASFALLPPDTRREGIGAGPYGSWGYGGNHYNFGKVDEYGPLFLKAGLRRNVGVNGRQGHKYKMSPPAVSWDRYRKMTEEERVADIRRQREDNPNVTTFLMFHEDAPWSYQHAWELTGQKVPDPEKYGVAGWKVGSGNMKDGMDKRAERHRRAMEQCKFMREHFPEVKITMGNSLACTEIIAEQLR